ncbi:MAG: hypothetical protein ACREDC_06840 [Bradyrhizobium sp.]
MKEYLIPCGRTALASTSATPESDAPAIDQPVSPVVEVEQAAHRFIEHG